MDGHRCRGSPFTLGGEVWRPARCVTDHELEQALESFTFRATPDVDLVQLMNGASLEPDRTWVPNTRRAALVSVDDLRIAR